MRYKTKFSEEEVYTYFADIMSDKYLEKLILENNTIRLKYGAYDKKSFKYNREKAVATIKSLIFKNRGVREDILDFQNALATGRYKDLLAHEDLDRVKREAKTSSKEREVFRLILALWQYSLEEFNEYGDELFEDALKGVYKKKEEMARVKDKDENKIEEKEIEEVEDMKKDVLSMNLAQCIEIISKYDEKIKDYERKLSEKDETIKELKTLLNKAIDNKELKKDFNKLSTGVKQETKDIKEKNLTVVKNVESFKKEIAEVKSELSKQSAMTETKNKLLLNELTKAIKDMQNTISSTLLEDNRKSLKELKAEMEKDKEKEVTEVKTDIDNYKEKKDKVSQINKEKRSGVISSFDPEIDELLGDTL